MIVNDIIMQTSSVIDLGTFAIVISIMVGIITVWSAIKAAKTEAKKAADILQEIRTNSIEKINHDLAEIMNKMQLMEVRYADRIKNLEKAVDKLDRYNWDLRNHKRIDGENDI